MKTRQVLLAIASVMVACEGFVPSAPFSQAFARSTRHYSSAGEAVDPAAEKEKAAKRIENMVKDNRVMLFMKGTKIFPQCGFSNTAVQVLRAVDCDFYTFDVLSDPFIREGVKQYSEWPTIPQLYVNGEFVGGSDIMIELFQSGELEEIIGPDPEDEDE